MVNMLNVKPLGKILSSFLLILGITGVKSEASSSICDIVSF